MSMDGLVRRGQKCLGLGPNTDDRSLDQDQILYI